MFKCICKPRLRKVTQVISIITSTYQLCIRHSLASMTLRVPALMLVWPMSVPHLSCTKATRVSESPKLFLSMLALSYLLLLGENVLGSHYFWVPIAEHNIRCYSLMTSWSLQYEQRHVFLMYTEYLGTRVETDSNFCVVQK